MWYYYLSTHTHTNLPNVSIRGDIDSHISYMSTTYIVHKQNISRLMWCVCVCMCVVAAPHCIKPRRRHVVATMPMINNADVIRQVHPIRATTPTPQSSECITTVLLCSRRTLRTACMLSIYYPHSSPQRAAPHMHAVPKSAALDSPPCGLDCPMQHSHLQCAGVHYIRSHGRSARPPPRH